MSGFDDFVVRRRRYPYLERVGETKRAWLLRVRHRKRPVQVPKKGVEFSENVDGTPVVLISQGLAEICGLVEEVSL